MLRLTGSETHYQHHAARRSCAFRRGSQGIQIVIGSHELAKCTAVYAEGAPGEVFGIPQWGSWNRRERRSRSQLTGAGKGTDVTIIMAMPLLRQGRVAYA